jgi:hypothetical protein
MKTKGSILVLLFSAFLVFSACFSPWKGEIATITLNFSGSSDSDRAAMPLDDDTLQQLVHTITFYSLVEGEEGKTYSTSPGQTSIRISVEPGVYDIEVEATLDEKTYAIGIAEAVEVLAGQDNPVPIRMSLLLIERLERLIRDAEGGGEYTVAVTVSENIAPYSLSYDGDGGITITLLGVGEKRTIGLNGTGTLFTVGSGVKLVLDNITLQGSETNNASLVKVNEGALEMREGSAITGNAAGSGSTSFGGGVSVVNGTFVMNGGTISNNSVGNGGGGVEVGNGGTFTMESGIISDNTANESGGGVHVFGSQNNPAKFTMNGGTISRNRVYSHGAGVYVGNGSLTKTDGKIYGLVDEPGDTTIEEDRNEVIDRGKINMGHAIYAGYAQPVKYRDDTVTAPLSFDDVGGTVTGDKWQSP